MAEIVRWCIDGGSFSSRGTIYGVFFFLFEESFIGDFFLSGIYRRLTGSNGDGSKEFPDSNPFCMGRNFGPFFGRIEGPFHSKWKSPSNWAARRENPDVQPKPCSFQLFQPNKHYRVRYTSATASLAKLARKRVHEISFKSMRIALIATNASPTRSM